MRWPGLFGETGSACIEAWLSYASSSDSPPLLLFTSLPGNPNSPSSQLSSEGRPKNRDCCSPRSSLACQEPSFFLKRPPPPPFCTHGFPLSIHHEYPPSCHAMMVLILLTAVPPVKLSRQTQRSPSPRALLQSGHTEPLCSRVVHPPSTVYLHTPIFSHVLHLSPLLGEKANETVIYLSNISAYLCSQL